MRNRTPSVVLCLVLLAPKALMAQSVPSPIEPQSPQAENLKADQLFVLANQARAAAGLGRLEWDPALADAALKHCLRMAVEGPIAHRYEGEPDLTSRTGTAGAHFSLIEENIAVGSHPDNIHQGWLNSPEHRANLMNPSVDRVGIAVLANAAVIFAVADYARAVLMLTQTQVEAAFADLLRAHKLQITGDTKAARTNCARSGKYQGNQPPSLFMRWQNPDVTQLPQPLLDQLATGHYHQAAVGSCPAQDVNGAFTVYRVAVLLY
jgi:uncharacterized protein YkwD